MTTMMNLPNANPQPLFFVKLVVLLCFIFLPIPKPAFYIQGPIAIIISTTLYCCNSQRKSSQIITAVVVQTVLFMILGALFNKFSDHNSYTMALIAAVSIPNLIEPSQREDTHDLYDNEVDVGWLPLAFSFLLTYLTPGFSSSVITKSVFLPGISQTVAGAILEAAIEGWALHITLKTEITTKSVLGDLLSLPELEWSTFTPHTSLKLVMLCLPLVAAIIVVCTPSMKVQPSIMLPIAILMLQATLTAGLLWSVVFILCGCINYNLWNFRDRSHTGLMFMTQI